MSELYDSLEDLCEDYKKNFASIKSYDIRVAHEHIIRVAVVFNVYEHIYLAEKMASRDILDWLDAARRSVSLRCKRYGKWTGHTIGVEVRWVEEAE